MRRAALGALAFAMLLCVLVPTAQALDGSDWTVVATRGGVKITLNIQGEGTIRYFRVNRNFHSQAVPGRVIAQSTAGFSSHDTNSSPFHRIYFDTQPTAGGSFTYELSIASDSSAASDSPDTTRTVTAIALSAPDRPTGFTATAGNGEVALRWDDPSDPSIQSYEYRQKTGSGGYGSWTDISGSGASTISHTVGSLTNGTLYTFQVRAVNLTGDGVASNGASATPAAVPSKPGLPTLTVGNAQLTVSWVAPAANGASISDYDVRYRAGNSGPWTEWNDTDTGTTIGATITGLTNGQSYQVQVRATNSVGNSQWSNSRSATPAAQAPSKPVVPTLAVGNAQLTVSWVAPAANGALISDYDVRYRAGNSGSWTDANYNGTGTSTTISSLANGTGYQVQVRARNSVGWGGWSDSASATPAAPATVPAKPTGFAATAGNGQVVLSWDNPNDASIALWQVRRKTTGGYGSWTTIPSSGTGTISHTVSGLTNGTAYTFQVRARNLTGDGVASNGASATPATTPAAPHGPDPDPRQRAAQGRLDGAVRHRRRGHHGVRSQGAARLERPVDRHFLAAGPASSDLAHGRHSI